MFAEPKWKWLEAAESREIGTPVLIYDGPIALGEALIVAPAEFHHYLLSIHGAKAVLDRFQILCGDGRYYFAYDYTKAPADRGSMVLWFWTRSNLPAWARTVLKI